MAVKKDNKTNKWYYYGAYTDKSGKRAQYKKRGFKTKREACAAEAEFKMKINDLPSHITYSEVIDNFLLDAKKEIKSSAYPEVVNLYNRIKKSLGNNKMNKLSSDILQDYINNLDKEYSKRYVEKIYYKINRSLKYAVARGYISHNPLEKVKRDPRKDELEKEMLFWEPEDFTKFISCVDSLEYKALFSVLYYMGCRRGEAIALTWDDIDFKNCTIKINKTVATRLGYKPVPPKSKNGTRTITMPKKLIIILKEWKALQSNYYDFSDDKYVFGYLRPIPVETIRRNFKSYINQANDNLTDDEKILEIRIHDLRHSHASYLINNMSAGFTDFDIAKRLGDTVATLHKTYAHWFKSADKSIINFMDNDI